LLWVVPLTVYLSTLILTFARRPPVSHSLMTALLPAAILPAAVLLAGRTASLLVAIPIHLCALFVASMVAHGELARARPAAEDLTAYYLWIATGGVAGGVAASLLAPVVFATPLEYPIALVFACLCRPSAGHRSAPNRAMDIGI